MKKSVLTIAILFTFFMGITAQSSPLPSGKIVVISTTMGNIEVLLYDETPLHRDNMLKLIEQNFYKNQLFHRVIENFMIQGGDPNSIDAPKGRRLGTGGPGYQINAEFKPNLYHKKGALSAARQGDAVNPQKKSSGSQFYIVQGQVFTQDQLLAMQSSGHHEPFTKEQIDTYTTIGGTPHLDGGYTVFGEVIKGMEVIDKIAAVDTDPYDRPIEDVVYDIRIK